MQLTEKQLEIINADGHLLVTGGPGSGKTTVSIFKAAHIAARALHPGQKILFLSFARPTISRVIEAIEYEQQIPCEQKKRIEVETYHAFFWRILKAHGYLIGLPRKLLILPKPKEAIALSKIRNGYAAESKLSEAERAEKNAKEKAEKIRLACREGRICFELFARYTGKILHGSRRIRKLVATLYPVIILDEFQDTNADWWHVVQALGQHSALLALADPEQRIYDWIGADPERLNHFREVFYPVEIDLGTDNHRSAGTDIARFGNDLLQGKFQEGKYAGIQILFYPSNVAHQAWAALVTTTYKARMRLVKSGRQDWSLAVLVPTKKMTCLVSDAFRSPPNGMARIHHTAAIEVEAAILGAEIIAFLMQSDTDGSHLAQFVNLLCNYFRGKGGDTPTTTDIQEAENIQKAYDKWLDRKASGKEIAKKSLFVAVLAVYAETRSSVLTGDPGKDWLTIRHLLEAGACPRLKELAKEVRNVRLLEWGTQLRQALSQDWRDHRSYMNALAITQQAFVREHLDMNAKPESGVVVMNMHKAKGKQFDEVIIFEGWPIKRKVQPPYNADRIVRYNSLGNAHDQARQNLRVSVTRGKLQTTILTPKDDPCILLNNFCPRL